MLEEAAHRHGRVVLAWRPVDMWLPVVVMAMHGVSMRGVGMRGVAMCGVAAQGMPHVHATAVAQP